MAFRRRTIRRRAPLRRRGTFRRRYRRYRRAPARRRSRPDRYVLRAKYSYTHTVTDKSGQSVQFKPAASNFTEFNEIYKNFEGFRFKRLTCTIRPLFNVATPDKPVPNYCIAPYHAPGTTSISFINAQSLNKSKIYHGCRTAVRSFVPCALACHVYVQQDTTTDWTSTEARWSPRMECVNKAIDVPHFTHVVCFDAQTQTGPKQPLQYEITLSAVFIMYNQKSQSLK